MVKTPPAMLETWVQFLGWEDPLEKETETHSSILAWRIPWTKEPGGLQPIGLYHFPLACDRGLTIAGPIKGSIPCQNVSKVISLSFQYVKFRMPQNLNNCESGRLKYCI